MQIPLLEGISAACASGALKSMSGVLSAKARFISESGSVKAATSGRNCSGIWSSGILATSAPGGSSMTIRLTRPRSAAGSPIQKSSPAGAAISSAKNVPTLRPDTRLITSPTSQPNVRPWYPCAVPGSHTGRCAASAATIGSQASRSASGRGWSMTGSPARCDSSQRTGMSAFPSAANSGQ